MKNGFTGVFKGTEIVLGQKYKHYKGNTYELINIAIQTETAEELVIYKDSNGKVWARPIDMFFGYLEDGTKRFTAIEK